MCPSVDLLHTKGVMCFSFVVRAVTPGVAATPADPGGLLLRFSRCITTVVEPRGLEPRTSAVQGRRSPN